MKKRIAGVLMVMVTTVSLLCIGCGSGAGKASENVSEAAATETLEMEETEAETTGTEIAEMQADGATIEGLIEQGRLYIATDDSEAPISFHDEETDELTGFDIDCGNAIGEYLGLEVVWVSTSWDGLIVGLLANKFDAISSGMYITDARLEQVDFTEPYYTMDEVICVPEGNEDIMTAEDLPGHVIGAVAASSDLEDVLAIEGVEESDVMQYSRCPDGLLDISTGRIDCMVTESLMAAYYGENLDIRFDDPLGSAPIGIAVNKSTPEVTEKINEAIDVLVADGTFEEISTKWFGTNILCR